MPEVTIYGPNLNDQSKGTFHVHAAGCAHSRLYGQGRRYGGEPGWTIDAESRWEVTDAVYGDVMTDDPDYYATEAARRGLLLDLWFAPCLDKLPEGAIMPEPEPLTDPPDDTITMRLVPAEVEAVSLSLYDRIADCHRRAEQARSLMDLDSATYWQEQHDNAESALRTLRHARWSDEYDVVTTPPAF